MIDYWKLGIIAGIVVAIFGSGWWVGHSKYVTYKAEVEAVAKTQEAHVESIEKQHALVTKGIQDEYDAKLALLRQYYAMGCANQVPVKCQEFPQPPAVLMLSPPTTFLLDNALKQPSN